ncbi:type II secretion system F family protein [Neobacillus sp. LXY-4]|uniref:type II secretion system F family protein n=1 Tax=Neobacillus sp. LXY-4 TaxID=3379826 RepID=UPI003EE22827
MIDVAFLVFTSAFVTFITAGTLSLIFRKKLIIEDRLDKLIDNSNYRIEVVNKSGTEILKEKHHFFQSYWNIGIQFVNKRISKAERRKLEIMLRDAGYQYKLTAIEFRLIQLLLTVCSGVVIFFLFLPLAENKALAWLLVISTALLFYRLPLFFLGKKRTQRIKEIDRAMADFFDMVNVLLEAGMGLDAALAEVSLQTKGSLGEEFFRTLEDMKLGKSRREAFYELRKRVPSEAFQSIMNSLIQADQLGIGMAKVLRSLTGRIREHRREKAREQAMKAPVKMLFPMVFFIFPSMFIVLLGPLVITLVTKGLGG